MKKLILVAALVASSFAVPLLPATAASALTDAESNCLVFPMLKKECWQLGADRAKAATVTVAAATETAVAATADAAVATEEAPEDVKLPLWWHCSRAPVGSGHLLDCSR